MKNKELTSQNKMDEFGDKKNWKPKYLIFPLLLVIFTVISAFLQSDPESPERIHRFFYFVLLFIFFGIGAIIPVYSLIIRDSLYSVISGILLSILFLFIGEYIGVWFFFTSRFLILVIGGLEAFYASTILSRYNGKLYIWWRNAAMPSILCCLWYFITFIMAAFG